MSYRDIDPVVSSDRHVGHTEVATLKGIVVVSTVKLIYPDVPSHPYETMIFMKSNDDTYDPEIIVRSQFKAAAKARHLDVVESIIHGRLEFQKDWWEGIGQ